MTPAFRYLFGWCKEHQVNKILNRIDQRSITSYVIEKLNFVQDLGVRYHCYHFPMEFPRLCTQQKGWRTDFTCVVIGRETESKGM